MLETVTGLAKQFRRQSEIALGGIDIHMPKVSRKLREQSLDIAAVAVTGCQSMHCKRVSQIVQPWYKAAWICAANADPSAQSLESVLCQLDAYWQRMSRQQKERFRW